MIGGYRGKIGFVDLSKGEIRGYIRISQLVINS
jgi:hypothetical protein